MGFILIKLDIFYLLVISKFSHNMGTGLAISGEGVVIFFQCSIPCSRTHEPPLILSVKIPTQCGDINYYNTKYKFYKYCCIINGYIP